MSFDGDIYASGNKTVKVGVFNSYPLIFQDNNGTIKGLYIDLLTEISKNENINFEYVFGTWQQCLDRVKTDEVDMLTSVGYTDERATYMDYCRNPILTVWGELYTLKSSKLSSLLDFSGRKIGVLQGDIFLTKFKELIREFNISCIFIELSSYEDVLLAVAAGQVDAGIVDVTYGTAKFRELNLRPSGVVFNPIDIYFTTPQNRNQALRDILDSYLAKWKNQDTSVYSQAKQKWLYGSVGAVTVLPDWIFNVLILIGIIIPGSFAFIILLKFKVNQKTNEIKISEDALRKSESLLLTLINTIPDLIWLKDINGVYLRCNKMFELFFGAPEKEIIGRTDYDFVERELADFFRMNDQAAIEAGRPSINEEWITFASDSRRVQLETIKTPMYEKDGNLIGILGIGRDITARKNMEDALHESELLYRSLVENSLVGVFIIQDNLFRFVNHRFCEITGYTADQLIEIMSPVAITYPDDINTVEENIRKRITGELDFVEYVFRVIKKDGTVIFAKVSGGTFNYKGKTAIMSTIEDITDQKLAQDALRESEETFRALTENSIDVIMRFDSECRHLYVNPIVEQQTGISPDLFIGKTHRELGFPEDICDLLYKSIKKVFANGVVERTLFQLPNGKWVDWLLMPEFDQAHKVKAVITSARDFTEYRKLEHQLQQAQKMETVGTLAG